MAEFENKRPRRTPEERASEMNCKIDKLNQSILQLEIKNKQQSASMMPKLPLFRNELTC